MIEKSLLDLLGKEKRGLAVTIAWMVFGLLCNLAITAGICCMIGIMVQILAHRWTTFCIHSLFSARFSGDPAEISRFLQGGRPEGYTRPNR